MNTCDSAQVWTTPTCQNQDHPQLTVQNLTFVDGDATGLHPDGGGGAIFVRGGRFKIVNSRFFHDACDSAGPDVGGGAVRVLSQYQGLPVYVVNSTFGGSARLANVCANGGGLSSIGVSWTVVNSVFTSNAAIGWGANPARPGTPGGGSGGAIYCDGNTFTLTLCGVRMTGNTAKEGGGAIFFVSNDRTGSLRHRRLLPERQPERWLRDRGLPRDLRARGGRSGGDALDDRVSRRPGAAQERAPAGRRVSAWRRARRPAVPGAVQSARGSRPSTRASAAPRAGA